MDTPRAQQPGLSPSLHSSQDISCSSLLPASWWDARGWTPHTHQSAGPHQRADIQVNYHPESQTSRAYNSN